MAAAISESLLGSPQRVLSGFGQSSHAASRALSANNLGDAKDILGRALGEGMPLALRGAGRSYGDAALSDRHLVLDLTGWNRILSWDASTGIAEAEPGVTVGDLWRKTLPDGHWPAVVPGTMAPTLGGCLAMNIHGKNNFKVGPIGDHILDFDLLTPAGEVLRCSRELNSDVFHAAIGGFGALGIFTRIRLQLKKVQSGLLRVHPLPVRSLEEVFGTFEEHLPASDYLVGWIDAFATGSSLGRGILHQANYLNAADDPEGPARTLAVAHQGLPASLFGVPKGILWRFMKPFWSNPGIRLLNTAKYWAGRLGGRAPYLQSHTAFAFLLDYVPDWRKTYEPRGFIQHQPFVLKAEAPRVFREILELCQREGLPPYLVVVKRHRPDPFLLTHAVDGYSLAMDFAVPADRERLWKLCHRVTDLVLDAGGRFYFAKDSVLRPADALRMWGPERLEAFATLKRRLDPRGILRSDLMRRALPGL